MGAKKSALAVFLPAVATIPTGAMISSGLFVLPGIVFAISGPAMIIAPRTRLEDELVQISLERDEVVTDRFDELAKESLVLDIPKKISGRELFNRLGEKLGPLVGLPATELERLLL